MTGGLPGPYTPFVTHPGTQKRVHHGWEEERSASVHWTRSSWTWTLQRGTFAGGSLALGMWQQVRRKQEKHFQGWEKAPGATKACNREQWKLPVSKFTFSVPVFSCDALIPPQPSSWVLVAFKEGVCVCSSGKITERVTEARRPARLQ